MIHGKVLVTGATGDTGRATVDELLARGHDVRALAHKEDKRSKALQERGVEVVYGDLDYIDEVRSAFCGVRRAYFVYPIKPGIVHATAQFAQAAIEVGADGIVNMSQKSARENAKSHAMKDHWLAERVFDWSGLNVAHIRPTLFAEWLLYVAPMIKTGLLHVPFGTGKHAPITAEDQARVIAGILEDPASHKGAIYPLYGPVEFNYQETATLLGRMVGKEIVYKQVGFEEFKQTLRSRAEPPARGQELRALAEKSERTPEQEYGDEFLFQHLNQVVADHQDGIFAGTNDLVEKIGGHPPMSLEAFITKNREAFV